MSARIFYSASRGGFYDAALHAILPDDAVPITRARHAELLAGQASGASIVAGKNGRPALSVVKPTLDLQRASLVTAVKREAMRRILAVAPVWKQVNDNAAIALEALAGGARDVDAALDRRRAIDALREAADALEAAIARMGADALAAFDVRDDAHWSAP